MSGIKHWLVPDWPAPANIHAATTMRTGGVSRGAFSSLNPAIHVGDDTNQVGLNRQIIREMLDLPAEPVWLDQVHSNRAVKVVNPPYPPFEKGGRGDLQQADASYTDQPGIVCAVLTADCLPLLVSSSDGTQVAAIHAGWRGLLAGVISNTLAAMQEQDFLVWLGPAIGPNSFEVGAEVRDAFLHKSMEFNPAFKAQNNGKWLADIYQLARVELAAIGITKVYGGTHCTFTDQERFYSYRRDAQTGRMATLIWRE